MTDEVYLHGYNYMIVLRPPEYYQHINSPPVWQTILYPHRDSFHPRMVLDSDGKYHTLYHIHGSADHAAAALENSGMYGVISYQPWHPKILAAGIAAGYVKDFRTNSP